jgi:hypothetical protein
MDGKIMGAEEAFGEKLARRLRQIVPLKYNIETKRSLLYAVSFDDQGSLQLGQNADREPTRGGGTGFEQDLLLFERSSEGQTSIIPRVSIELKFSRVSTHDSIVYSEKARRIRAIYPFVRYGLILGGSKHIPARTLRLGSEFDFIVATAERISTAALDRLAKLLRLELRLSGKMTAVLRGRERIALLHRSLKYGHST